MILFEAFDFLLNRQCEMKKISYEDLNARQKESYNFQKVSAVLADYGFVCIRLNDDWNGADFIAQHIDGINYLKVQLKARLTFDKKYIGKDLHVCFPNNSSWYLYTHDKLLEVFLKSYPGGMAASKSWVNDGLYSWNYLGKKNLELLDKFRID